MMRRDVGGPSVSIDGVHDYLKGLQRSSPLLSAAEEVDIARAIEVGQLARDRLDAGNLPDGSSVAELSELVALGERAHRRLIESNLRLVVSMARRWGSTLDAFDFADIIQAGNIGLLEAVTRFDFAKGYKFSTYAAWWIRNSIQNCQRETRTIRLAHNVWIKHRYILQSESDIQAEFGRPATTEEVATRAGVKPSLVRLLRCTGVEPMSLNVTYDGGEFGDGLPDSRTLSPDDRMVASALESDIELALSTLSAFDRCVIELRFGLGEAPTEHSCGDVGRALGLTASRVKAIENRALAQLRMDQTVKPLIRYLEVG